MYVGTKDPYANQVTNPLYVHKTNQTCLSSTNLITYIITYMHMYVCTCLKSGKPSEISKNGSYVCKGYTEKNNLCIKRFAILYMCMYPSMYNTLYVYACANRYA